VQKVSDLWQAFNEAQSAIEELEPEEVNEPIHLEERDTFENRYFAVTVQLETLIDRKIAHTRPVIFPHQTCRTTEGELQHLWEVTFQTII